MPQPALPSPIAAEEIFRVAAALPVEERAAYLATACAAQPAMRARIERMQQAHEIGAFLRKGTHDPGASEIEAELASAQPEQAGERIGHYQLLERLGEGGFGVVWVAAQEHPVRRQVALKIIKLGMDTREVIARFEQERQALALMDHPGIAKVFDAGATPTGRPYFVMELVHGVPITDYCDRERLPTADRLQLFIAVCQAVQHAHQKGIIHRDLKPSNILVAVQDGVAVPKVIDFGVAKAIQSQKLTGLTLCTQLEQMIGTPLYMSPEQAESSAVDIDTRADIYALGVLLYELLTGRTPFDPEELMRAGVDEMRCIIREVEPPRPSTVVRRSSTAVPAVGPAGVPPAEPDPRSTGRRDARVPHSRDGCATTRQPIASDLDWIVMKALEKDRTRRYETASDFALDVRRHLSSEPVAARAPSFGYRAGKFVRRNRRMVAAAGAVFLALLAGLIASTVLYLREKAAWASAAEQHQKAGASAQFAENEAGNARAQMVIAKRNAEAEAEARREAEAIATFLTEVFQSPDPARDGRTITVAETLDRAARKLDTELADQPQRRANFQDVLGRTYRALGLAREAILQQEKAVDHFRKTFGPEHPEAIPMIINLANSYSDAGRRDEALKMREEVLDLCQQKLGSDHRDTLTAMTNLAVSYSDAGRREEALQLREKTLQLCRKVLDSQHPDTLNAMHNLAISYCDDGRREEAFQLREKVLALRHKTVGPEHPDTLKAMSSLAISYSRTGRREEAIGLQEQVLALRSKHFGPEHPGTLRATSELAWSYDEAGRRKEALRLREQVFELSRKARGPEHPETLMAMSMLGWSSSAAGRPEEALKLQEQALELCRRILGPEHPDTLTAMNLLANSYHNGGRREEALEMREKVLALRRKILAPEDPNTLGAMTNLAISYRRAGRIQEAIDLQEKALAIKRRVLPPRHSFLQAAITNLAECYEAVGRTGEAQALRKELATLQK